jgi:putative transposon-encoded protein
VEKRTDVHNNSKTGWGDFKWRFKFLLEVPCEFPRIKFTIQDAGVFTDEAIGEATLNLKNTISKLEKEGMVEIPKTYIVCSNANMPDQERGVLMFSMTILLKEEADADPVGESWDEPNHSPFLKKPTAGRGFADLVSGGFNFDFDFSWNPFGKYLPFLICLFIVLLMLTAAMYLKMFGF